MTRLMIDAHDLKKIQASLPKLGRYMFNYLAMMMTISSIFLIIDGSPEALGKRTQLWEYLRGADGRIYHKMRYRAVSAGSRYPAIRDASSR